MLRWTRTIWKERCVFIPMGRRNWLFTAYRLPLGDLGHRRLFRLPQNLHHLLLAKSSLLHVSSLPDKAIFQSFSWDANRLAAQPPESGSAREHRNAPQPPPITVRQGAPVS